MKHVEVCDEQTIEAIRRALRASALGKRVSLEIQAGMNRHRDGDRIVEVPNGTMTIRVFVNGGAVNQDVPADTPEAVQA